MGPFRDAPEQTYPGSHARRVARVWFPQDIDALAIARFALRGSDMKARHLVVWLGGLPLFLGGCGAEQDAGSPGPSGGHLPPQDALGCRSDGDGRTTLVFVNGCSEVLSVRGSELEDRALAPGGFACVDIGSDSEPLSSKRYWGFVGNDPGPERHTLAEFTFNTDFYDFDWYNISHVDAHNLPMQIVPAARPDCEPLTCAESLLAGCPAEARFEDPSGRLVSCVSPARDDPNSAVARHFEQCSDAYAWSGDDQEGDDPSPMRACAGEDWDIVFCPEPEK